jgi:DNA modification methylase
MTPAGVPVDIAGSREVTFLDGRVRLICGDCREVLPTLGRVDAVVTDPPYGISYQHGSRRGGRLMGTDGMSIVGDDALAACRERGIVDPFKPKDAAA